MSDYAGPPPSGPIRAVNEADYSPGRLCQDCGTLLYRHNTTGLCGRCAQERRHAEDDERLLRARQTHHRIYVTCRWMELARTREAA